MAEDFAEDVARIGEITIIPTILDVVCRVTGLRFAAIARVTEGRWIACAVRDEIAFGLAPGGELAVETTLCHEVRCEQRLVVIDDVAADPVYRHHHTPAQYGFRSYISVPIRRPDGSFFGTLCAIDPAPNRLATPDTIGMFEMFAQVIGHYLGTIDQARANEVRLLDERKAAALREQFIAVLGHDLRNPLAAIDGGVRLLRKTPLNAQALTLLGMMQASVVRMGGLIDAVVDFARFRLGGGLALDREAVPIEALLRQVVAELQAGRQDWPVETAFDLPPIMSGDRRRLAQLASNLLGNAMSHGAPDLPVRLEARVEAGWFELIVANGGEPIPPEIRESIFEPFARGSLRPHQGGLGLGLYIARRIAEAHGGRIELASTPEETRFTFRMPVAG
ncbi:GAF domain-containing sensor histidine kinase [Belnapia sp. T6]|uniref:histidine kinase n=1 Tax=Belnapia mucosa TaxID=2804532 RepID=A0ABS1V2J7_9PROT|nr:GAF domain-containing sensor histidine kinase [Belnapia mucosa]MBL6455927.1 GAF domain-containing sensor histidine kinase [Belnapia mucosa]